MLLPLALGLGKIELILSSVVQNMIYSGFLIGYSTEKRNNMGFDKVKAHIVALFR
jgi:hypothetical protein